MSLKERRLPTPLVLVATSAMVSVGLFGLWAAARPPQRPDEGAPLAVELDASTPERAAESFLDAWRKRAHDAATSLAVGPARARVRARAERDAHLTDHERELKAQVWDAMAAERLRLRLHEAENLTGGKLRLRGTAEGSFLGHPYSRAVEFVLRPQDDAWRVEDFTFGEILSDTPRTLDLRDE